MTKLTLPKKKRLLFAYNQLWDPPVGMNGVSVQIRQLVETLITKECGDQCYSVVLYTPDDPDRIKEFPSSSMKSIKTVQAKDFLVFNRVSVQLPNPIVEYRMIRDQRLDVIIIENTCISGLTLWFLAACWFQVPVCFVHHSDILGYLRSNHEKQFGSGSWIAEFVIFLETLAIRMCFVLIAITSGFLRITRDGKGKKYTYHLVRSPISCVKEKLYDLWLNGALISTRNFPMILQPTQVNFKTWCPGVDSSIFNLASQSTSGNRNNTMHVRDVSAPIRLLFVGRVCIEKRVDVLWKLMDHLARLTDCKFTLTVAGSNNGYDLSKILASNQHINYVGEILNRQELATLYRGHDYLLHPSGDFDTFAATIVEGMLCGCIPLVIGHRGGPGWIIEHGKSGFVFETLLELITFLERQGNFPVKSSKREICRDATVARGKQFTRHASDRKFMDLMDEIIFENGN